MIENLIGNFESYLHGSFILGFLASYIAGVLVGLTPCVYPVIPIIVGFIGAKENTPAGNSTFRHFLLSLIYVCGMAVTYMVLGGISALSGMLFGSIQSNPWIYFAAGNLCFFLGLSMLGFFKINIRTPLFMQKLQEKDRGGILGSFLLGATSGMLIGPCTGPVLAALLVFVATRQNILFGMSLLFVFAFGMGTLMIIMGTFAGILRSLPRSGYWMVNIQKIFGWILVATGEYYLIIAGQFWL